MIPHRPRPRDNILFIPEAVMNSTEEKNLSIAREFLKALESKHAEQMLSCFANDAVWISPEGTFSSHAQIQSYMEWQFNQADDIKIRESGNGIVVEGNKAFIEHTISYRRSNERIDYTVLCSLEMKENKIVRIRTVYDRLSLENKLVRDRITKWAVNRTLKQAEKKLPWRK
jgi:ketosteroid isomerase-like protein